MGLSNGNVVALNYQGRAIRAPIWILPGHAANSVTVHLGYGRTHTGNVGAGTGFNAYALRTVNNPWFDTGVEIRKLSDNYQLATTQLHQTMEGRDIVRVKTLEEFTHPEHEGEGHGEHEPASLMADFPYEGNAWGMAIDLGNCTSCNACVAACNAENNVAVVGKEQVYMGREMHWLRVDLYYSGELDNPVALNQPVMCQQCEQAPCEVVCPVAATAHSAEGLNDMVYNRCVGTRFCANNCPYKVRRFNFYQFQETEVPVIQLRHNPDVTVRSRGVMEKCSYCVQRINEARVESKKADRPIKDGEVMSACQQVCPTQAIVFGNINDHDSQVYKLKHQSRNYGLLAELNTKPRTTYLTKIMNPNAEIKQGDA
jgi:molybdopterin-containing oxidoreductase family iron-sulfur binding subunit